MTSDVPQSRVRCRQIGEDDIAAVIDLLKDGFPTRPRDYWVNGFRRQAGRLLPADVPRYGMVLESDGRIVGSILLLYAERMIDGESRIRCNLSSWYVDPAFRGHASMMIFMAVRSKTRTYVNISPVPHTIPTIEAQGFRRYVAGTYLGMPCLGAGVRGARIRKVEAGRADASFLALPERDLLLDHAAMGCLSLVVETADGLHPFVFLPFRIRAGRFRPPIRQLIFCRDIADYMRFSGMIGRYLLWRGSPFIVHDADGPELRIPGHFFVRIGQKFSRGPDTPRFGDLAYTERVIFGP